MITFDKKIVKMNEKTRLVMRCFLDALDSNKIKDSTLFAEKSKTSGFWSILITLFPAGIQGTAIDILQTKEYQLHCASFPTDPEAEKLYVAYRTFWNKTLEADDFTQKEMVAEIIDEHDLLIKELLCRTCADAMSISLMPEHDGRQLVSVMHSFIENIIKKKE